MDKPAEVTFYVLVKPSSPKNAMLGYDEQRQAYRVAVAAPAQGNRANAELIKFLSKELGKKARIVAGQTSKRKRIILE